MLALSSGSINTSRMRKAVFIDLPNFYSRLLKSGLGEARELRDYFLHWLDLDLVSKWLTGEFSPTWVFYSGRRFGPSSERIEGERLEQYIKRINRLTGVTPYDANIPGEQREPFTTKCDCGKMVSGQWESEKGVDTSLIVHLFDTADSWDEAVLLSGDADFTPAVRALRRRGKIISGAGFADAAECLVREFYRFEDLAKGLLRNDFAAYLMFGEEGIIWKWLNDEILPQEVKDEQSSVELSCAWNRPQSKETSYSVGRCLSVLQAHTVVLKSKNLITPNSRSQLLEDFVKRLPEFSHNHSILLVDPAVWERVARVLPDYLRAFSGAATGDTGQIKQTFAKQSDGLFVRKCEG